MLLYNKVLFEAVFASKRAAQQIAHKIVKTYIVIILVSSGNNPVHSFFRTAQEWSCGRRGGSCCPTCVSSTTEVSPAAFFCLFLFFFSAQLKFHPWIIGLQWCFCHQSLWLEMWAVRNNIPARRGFKYVSWHWDLLRPWLLPWQLKRNHCVALSS